MPSVQACVSSGADSLLAVHYIPDVGLWSLLQEVGHCSICKAASRAAGKGSGFRVDLPLAGWHHKNKGAVVRTSFWLLPEQATPNGRGRVAWMQWAWLATDFWLKRSQC